MTAYWESDDKHVSVQAILDNQFSRTNVGELPDAHAVQRFGYRF